MPEKLSWISDSAGVGVGKEDEEFQDHTYYNHFITVSAQGKTVEIGIPESVYEEFLESFNDISE